MKIAVIGATSSIGQELLHNLLKSIFKAISKTSINLNRSYDLGITEAIQTLIETDNKVFSSLCVKEDININEPLDFWNANFKQLKK